MQEPDPETSSSSLNLYDVLFILYKHKWKVMLCAVAGLAAAAVAYFTDSPLYQSDAKILVRYVVDRSAVDPVEGASANTSKLSEAALYSEIEILTSWDLFEQVAEAVGVERLVPKSKGSATKVGAAKNIEAGLSVTVRGAGVIVISYKNSDPELAAQVLDALLKSYFTKHLEIHRSKATFDFVSQQNELLRARLTKTEEDLRKKKADAGIFSVADTAAAISSAVSSTEHELSAAQTELARQSALVVELEKSIGGTSASAPDPEKAGDHNGVLPTTGPVNAKNPPSELDRPQASPETIEKYEACVDELTALRKKGIELRSRYSSEALPVKSNQADISVLENQRHDLERRYPDLLGKAVANVTTPGRQTPQFDLGLERARLAGMEAGMLVLETRMHDVQERSKEFARISPEIEDLDRDKQLEQTSYTSSRSKLDSASVDEALDPSKIPNISTVQKPSPALRVIGTRQKIELGLAGGGIGLGIALALLSELVLDRTVKRPLELERQLRIPLLLSIPYILPGKDTRVPRLNSYAGKDDAFDHDPANGSLTVAPIAPWEPAHFIRHYSEVIRDRLSLYFEINNLTHKPKMIAVTGFSKNSGSSTIAAGVAAALSETGDGKVLLVDMNVGQAEVHPFFQGKPACSLPAALEQNNQLDSAAENLYLATGVEPGTAAPVRFKRFHDLLPNFEASAFDYIIFDMPPVGQTSPTTGMARFMDKVLFVVESERCNQEMVKRAYTSLVGGRSNVSVVLNKVRSHAPKWLEGEL